MIRSPTGVNAPRRWAAPAWPLRSWRRPSRCRTRPSRHRRPVRRQRLVQLGEERLVAHALAQFARILEQALGQVNRERRLGVLPAHELGVLAGWPTPCPARRSCDTAPAGTCGHASSCGAPPRRPIRESSAPACCRPAGVEHRHEVALAGAEIAVQVGACCSPSAPACWMKPRALLKASTSCGVTT